MQGHWSHGRAYYRCKFTEDYPAGDVEHRRNVYVTEDVLLPGLDRWLATLFDDDHFDDTCDRSQSVIDVLADAEPQDKTELYDQLGISLAYDPDGTVTVESRARGVQVRVGGGT
jgi:hypothetical protein